MILQSLSRLDQVQLRFLFVVVAGIMQRCLDRDEPGQGEFWKQVSLAIEDEREADPPEDLSLDDVLNADLEKAATMSRGLASGQVDATREFFAELADQLEVELARRRKEVIALERLR